MGAAALEGSRVRPEVSPGRADRVLREGRAGQMLQEKQELMCNPGKEADGPLLSYN